MSENYKLTIMKELSIEEKAKAYDEAIEKAKIWQEHLYDVNDKDYADELNYIFPELKESEDEKIRNQIIEHIKWCEDGGYCAKEEMTRWISWLEKQGETSHILSNSSNIGKDEKKPADKVEPKFKVGDTITDPTDSTFTFHINAIKDGKYIESDKDWVLIEEADNDYILVEQKPAWSEEDNIILSRIIADYERSNEEWFNAQKSLHHGRKITWLKSIKDRIQPKQEWSEEDNQYLCGLIGLIEQSKAELPITLKGKAADNCIDWLKSLRPQNRWKPSEEQIKVCKEVYADILSAEGFDLGTVNSELNRLEEELKKLMEE